MHFHTSFDQVLTNSSYLKIFKKYASKIYGFVWLSKQTCQEAISNGFVNSRCIYNPLMFSEERCADIKNKKILFIGRMAEEKRVHLAIEYFSEVVKNKNLSDWIFVWVKDRFDDRNCIVCVRHGNGTGKFCSRKKIFGEHDGGRKRTMSSDSGIR